MAKSGQVMIAFDCTLARAGFLFDVAFEAGPGVTALFGASGSGKTTAIKLLAGIERPDRGRIAMGDTVLIDTATGQVLPPHRRFIGLVSQDANLFPHLNVRANLLYGRWFKSAAQRTHSFDAIVTLLGLTHLLDRAPTTLSGGERQRVGIGRAILSEPRLLLMDEPLASLDAERKLEILPFIENLRDELNLPIIYVSHAVDEVARLAQTVVRLSQGRVAAIGSPVDVLASAKPEASGERFDVVSLVQATFERYLPDYGVSILNHPAGDIVIPGPVRQTAGPIRILVRATNVTLSLGTPENVSVRTALMGRMTQIETDDGPLALVTLALTGGDLLRAYATRLAIDALGLKPGSDVVALVKASAFDERAVPGLRAIAEPKP